VTGPTPNAKETAVAHTHAPRRSLRRTISVASVAALAMTALPAGLVAADEPNEPRDTDFACQEPYDAEFDDVSEDNTHFENILCAADFEIARGYLDGTYRPRNSVQRDQMASFVTRLIEQASGDELEEGDDDFDDVPEGNTHAENIRKLTNIDLVEGFGDGTYRPGQHVTRDQMASFIARAISYLDDEDAREGDEPPAAEEDHFDDVGEESRHHGAINALAEQGIVAGDGQGNYNPRNDVRRDQMASFLMRSYDYAIEAMLVFPPFLDFIPTPGNGDDGEDAEGPSVMFAGAYMADRLFIAFDDEVEVLDPAGFKVYDDDACTSEVTDGFEAQAGGPFVDLLLTDELDDGDHWFQLDAGAVEDGDGVANEVSDCDELQEFPLG
jgi:hypothetical protein